MVDNDPLDMLAEALPFLAYLSQAHRDHPVHTVDLQVFRLDSRFLLLHHNRNILTVLVCYRMHKRARHRLTSCTSLKSHMSLPFHMAIDPLLGTLAVLLLLLDTQLLLDSHRYEHALAFQVHSLNRIQTSCTIRQCHTLEGIHQEYWDTFWFLIIRHIHRYFRQLQEDSYSHVSWSW